jgi:guanylate kinase
MVVKDVGSRIRRRGLMLVLSSPSGAGKSTIARNLMESDPAFELSVSVTTRPRRGSEIGGVHYHFVSQREFDSLRDDGALLEWAEVHGNFYATPRGPAEKAMAEGRDMLFDIDWQGAQQLYQEAGPDVVRVFVLPPTMEELERRLRSRGTDSDEVITARMERAANEISHWDGYDYVLINDNVEGCFDEVCAILRAERLKRRRQIGLIGFARDLIRSVPDADKNL